jgi:hypothetical protein
MNIIIHLLLTFTLILILASNIPLVMPNKVLVFVNNSCGLNSGLQSVGLFYSGDYVINCNDGATFTGDFHDETYSTNQSTL